jgi:hypothetical protein
MAMPVERARHGGRRSPGDTTNRHCLTVKSQRPPSKFHGDPDILGRALTTTIRGDEIGVESARNPRTRLAAVTPRLPAARAGSAQKATAQTHGRFGMVFMLKFEPTDGLFSTS